MFLSECGLDPGIDHMSAMQLLNNIRDKGGTIKLFESFTGGLLSPSSEGSIPGGISSPGIQEMLFWPVKGSC